MENSSIGLSHRTEVRQFVKVADRKVQELEYKETLSMCGRESTLHGMAKFE